MAFSSSPSWSTSKCHVPTLLGLVLAQWALLAYVLTRQESTSLLKMNSAALASPSSHLCQALRQSVSESKISEKCDCPMSLSSVAETKSEMSTELQLNSTAASPEWEGVAMVLLLRRPKWFYKRYNIMIHNGASKAPN